MEKEVNAFGQKKGSSKNAHLALTFEIGGIGGKREGSFERNGYASSKIQIMGESGRRIKEELMMT